MGSLRPQMYMGIKRPILPVGLFPLIGRYVLSILLHSILHFPCFHMSFFSLNCPILPLDSVPVTRHQTLISFSWQGVSFRSKVPTDCRGMMASRRVVAELRDQNPHYSDPFALKSTWQHRHPLCLPQPRVCHPHRAFPRDLLFHRCLFVRSLFPMPPVLMSKQQLMLFLQGWGRLSCALCRPVAEARFKKHTALTRSWVINPENTPFAGIVRTDVSELFPRKLKIWNTS